MAAADPARVNLQLGTYCIEDTPGFWRQAFDHALHFHVQLAPHYHDLFATFNACGVLKNARCGDLEVFERHQCPSHQIKIPRTEGSGQAVGRVEELAGAELQGPEILLVS